MPNTELKPRVVRVAVGVVWREDDKILISRRQKGQHLAGLWEFPGGKIEAGESPELALIRELKEEVGLIIRQPEELFTIDHTYPEKTVQLVIILAKDFSGEALGKEGQDVLWVDRERLPEYSFPEANIKIMDYLLAQPILT